MADGDRRQTKALRPLLPNLHGVTGTRDDMRGQSGRSSSHCCDPASHSEASVLHATPGALPGAANPSHHFPAGPQSHGDCSANSISSFGELPLQGDLAAGPGRFPGGETLDGSIERIISQSCDTRRSSDNPSENDVDSWVKARQGSFPGRLYNQSPAGETPQEPDLGDVDYLQLEARDLPDLPTHFQDEMEMRVYQRSRSSSKSDAMSDLRGLENPDSAKPGDDAVTHPGVPPDTRLPCSHDSSDLGQGLGLIPSTAGEDPMITESTTGYSSYGASVLDSASLASSSLLKTSINECGSAASVASFGLRYPCPNCQKSFKLAKDRERHFKSKHESNPETYACRCGYQNPRKDVIKRHVITKKCEAFDPKSYDICICKEFRTRSVSAYLEHIESHKKRRGRPPKKPQT